MDNDKFIDIAKETVSEQSGVELKGVYVVWLSKTLQNNKALLSTAKSDGMYYELTYNGDKKEMYFDAYKKTKNIAIKIK